MEIIRGIELIQTWPIMTTLSSCHRESKIFLQSPISDMIQGSNLIKISVTGTRMRERRTSDAERKIPKSKIRLFWCWASFIRPYSHNSCRYWMGFLVSVYNACIYSCNRYLLRTDWRLGSIPGLATSQFLPCWHLDSSGGRQTVACPRVVSATKNNKAGQGREGVCGWRAGGLFEIGQSRKTFMVGDSWAET